MAYKMLRALIILPGTVVLLVPALLTWLTRATADAAQPARPAQLRFWCGLLAAGCGLALAAWTMRLFATIGRGTPAPWNPPDQLVVSGPYRHVRNPMITGVLLMLTGEALLLRSLPVALWLAVFFAGNALYFPLVEEKGLVRRFGGAYREYQANVPRWLPRLTPWRKS